MERFLASLPSRPQPLWIRFGVTLMIMASSALIQLGVLHLTGFNGLFLLLPGIFAAGVIFDRGSGFFATLLALALAAYLMRSNEVYEAVILLVLFGLTGFSIAFVSEALRTTMEKLLKAERTKDVLLREIDHRTKNNMMNLASVLRLQARVASQNETKEALRGFANRIQVMANVHDHLTPSSPNREVNMTQYLEELCQRIEELATKSSITIRCKVDETVLIEKKALPLAFIVNELVTNSLKYAFPRDRQGVVEVDLKSNGELILAVSDNGVGRDRTAQPGVGTRLIDVMVQQLGGTIRYESADPGLNVTVRVPNSH